jgi:hypothetical protein
MHGMVALYCSALQEMLCGSLHVHAGKWTAATGPEGGAGRASWCQVHLFITWLLACQAMITHCAAVQYELQGSGQQQQALRAARGEPAGAKSTMLHAAIFILSQNQTEPAVRCFMFCAGKWTAATGPEGGAGRASWCQVEAHCVWSDIIAHAPEGESEQSIMSSTSSSGRGRGMAATAGHMKGQ